MDNKLNKLELLKIFEASSNASYNLLTRIAEAKEFYNREIELLVNKTQEIIDKGAVIVVQATGEAHHSWLVNNGLAKVYEKYGIVRTVCRNPDYEMLFKVSYDYEDKSENGILIPVFLPPAGMINDIQIFDSEEDARLFCEINNSL